MSRAHDSQRTFLPFGNPFRMILPKRSHNLSPKLLALLSSFEQTLAENLKKLKPENTSDVLTLSWLRQALELLSNTHTNIKTLVTDLQFPISDWDEKWVDIYLDNSVKLLDICIALSSELSRLDQGHLLLQYVLHILDSSEIPSSEHLKRSHASLHDWTKQVNLRSSRLETSALILPRLASSLSVAKAKNSAKGKVLMRVLYGVQVVTVFVCGVLVAALLGSAKPLMELRVPNKFLWAEAFNGLQGDVNGVIRSLFSSGKVMVRELEAVEACVEKLHGPTCGAVSDLAEGVKDEKCEELTGDVSELAEGVKELANGLDLFSKSDVLDLAEGAKDEKCEELKGNVSELAEGVKELANGLDLFSQGDVLELAEGVKELANGLDLFSHGDVLELAEGAKHEKCERLKGNVSELAEKAKELANGHDMFSKGDVLELAEGAKNEKCEELKGDVLELAEKAKELANGLDLFSKQVEDFFQIVLTGRDALLCNLREPDVVQEPVDENKP